MPSPGLTKENGARNLDALPDVLVGKNLLLFLSFWPSIRLIRLSCFSFSPRDKNGDGSGK